MGDEWSSKRLKQWGLAGTFAALSGVLIWSGADLLVGRTISRFSPQIEKTLSNSLGHPLKIGSYRGLRLWGIELGPTRLLPGIKDSSSVNISTLTIKFAPFASLFNWQPVAIFNPKGTEILLSKNDTGSFWIVPQNDNPKKINLQLKFNLKEPTKILLNRGDTTLLAKGNLSLNLGKKKIYGAINIDSKKQGSLFLSGKGYWDGIEFQTKVKVNKLSLGIFEGILGDNSNIIARGNINGNLNLGVKKGLIRCKGGLIFNNLTLNGGGLSDTLSANKSTIKCDNNKLQLKDSNWNYGYWNISNSVEIPFYKKDKTYINSVTKVKIKDFEHKPLSLKLELPISVVNRQFIPGELNADFNLESFPLGALNQILNASLSGKLNTKGGFYGPLTSLNSTINLSLENPQINGIRLREKWRGSFTRIPSEKKWGSLRMESEGASIPGNLQINLNKYGNFNSLNLNRLGGEISLKPKLNAFEWDANKFRLDRVEVAFPPEKGFKRIFGEVSGNGILSLDPLFFNGDLNLDYFRLLGFKLKKASIKGQIKNSETNLTGELIPSENGKIKFDINNVSEFSLLAQVKDVSSNWIAATALEFPKLGLKYSDAMGKAEDIEKFIIGYPNSSIDSQLVALTKSQNSYREEIAKINNQSIINPYDLNGKINADIKLSGPSLSDLNLEAKASGKVWTNKLKIINSNNIRPFKATFNGNLASGMGDFSLLNFNFSLLSLVAPIPSAVDGYFGLKGKYNLGNLSPRVTADLIIKDTIIYNRNIILDNGNIFIKDNYLEFDIAIRDKSSANPVKLVGTYPLISSYPIDLKVESHGDGLAFLTGLTKGNVSWTSGTADLSVLISGTPPKPVANGFLVLKDSGLLFQDKEINNLNSTIVFDFNRLEVRNLKANIGANGFISSQGGISLFDAQSNENEPLALSIEKTRIKTAFSDVSASSNIVIKGSILKPQLAGEVFISEGSIFAKRANNPDKTTSDKSNRYEDSKAKISRRVPEQNWNQREPLVLFIQNEDAPASRIVSAGLPNGFESIMFDNLKLVLGPSLRLVSQPLASFETNGFLLLNGAFDETLDVSGVIKLVSGYVNLFTTTFNLDQSEPNVAVFVPSMGLVPYVDVTLKSRVPDNVRDVSNFSSNGMASFGIGGSRFVNVEVTASGPADRISENFQLRSTPSLGRTELLGLIGGNSLANLISSGGNSDVLASFLNRSFASYLQGNINGFLSDRLQISLYPAYITGSDSEDDGSDSGSSSSDQESANLQEQQAWVTEIGVDFNDKINFSVQAAPNRQDIPPKGNITFQMNPNVGLLGSFDKSGNWQSQLQLFFRY
ncbi:translocation/assembly module TamB [Prochlorococcus marinus]|uniref:translocation/assembly module TamB n=1 Tax=Prochlorococcus marinus TaxID=1219 RepID=UPI0022B494F6|nr:translocation/assembly module TamB [Prochlorococcus marinus]